MKEWKRILHAKSNQEYKVAILILGKIQLKSKKVIRNRKINKRSTKQEMTINNYTSRNIPSKHLSKNWQHRREKQFHNNSWETSLFHCGGFEQHSRSTKHKRNRQNLCLRWDLPKIDYMLGHKLNLNKLKKRCHKVPFPTTIDEVRLVTERKLKNPHVCGNWTTHSNNQWAEG